MSNCKAALKAAKQMALVMQNEYEEKLEESKTVLPECKVFNRKAPKTFHLEYKALVADLLASRLDATQVVHVLETVVTAVALTKSDLNTCSPGMLVTLI